MPLIYIAKQRNGMIRHVGHALAVLRDVKIYALALLLPLLFLASCSSDDASETTDTNTKNVMVQFTISVGNSASGNGAKRNNATRSGNAATRADGDVDWTRYTPNEEGVGVENRLEVNHLHVLLYTTDSNGNLSQLAGQVRNLTLSTTSDAEVYNVFGEMTIPTDRLINDETFQGRLVIFANTDNSTNDWSVSNLDNITYGYSADYSVGSPSNLSLNSIPMWGMSAVQTISLKGGQYNDLGTVDLLRSMAKVRVHLTAKMRERGFRFDQILFNRYNTSGCVMPSLANVNALSSSQSTRNLTYSNSLHLPQSVTAATTPLSFLENEGDTVSQTLYLPEYSDAANPASITVTVRGGSGVSSFTRTASFDVAAYKNGGKTGNMDIVRNHDYEFYIYSEALRLYVYVVDWTVIRHPEISL